MTPTSGAAFLEVATIAAMLTWLLVRAIRRYALQRQMVDRAGSRTSHVQVTPRGGGAGIIPVLVGIGALAARYSDDWRLGLALAAITAVGIVGWYDDRRSLGVGVRFTAHLFSALLLLPLAASLPAGGWYAGGIGLPWWIFWGVSSINVVNFMDGIDGLIGLQMVIFGVHLAIRGGADFETVPFAAALSGASVGFLVWNWSPARIFMGDTGSGALGLASVVGGLLAMRTGTGLVETFLPLGPIFLDATVTLLRRVHGGERLTDAHRGHLYQRLANGGWGHARVSLVYGTVALVALPTSALPVGLRRPAIAVYFIGIVALGAALDRRADRLGP